MDGALTIGGRGAEHIRWENWNDFRARALASLIADYLGRRTLNFERKTKTGKNKKVLK